MSDKRESRLRRAAQTRARQRELGVTRLAVHRTNQHIYAQVISGDGG
jgi:large subunit ribosomal protein L18